MLPYLFDPAHNDVNTLWSRAIHFMGKINGHITFEVK